MSYLQLLYVYKDSILSSSAGLFSRRLFLQGMTSVAALAGTSVLVQSAYAQENALLPFRDGAEQLFLHFNENSLGMSPLALKAGQAEIARSGHRYPDGAVEHLRNRLANKHSVPSNQIIMGNGSTEVIGAIVTLAAKNGASVIEPAPTFGDVRRRAKAAGMKVHQVPVGAEFKTDINALKERASQVKGPLLINICNPNNPTGSVVEHDSLVKWITSAPDNHTFLIDEAYFEYAQLNGAYSSVLPLILKGQENLVLTRTFSKIYGMAGMRVGYAIAAPKTAVQVRQFAADFNLSVAGVAAAVTSLEDDVFYQRSLKSNQKGKAILVKTLDELNLKHIESNTNFVLHRIQSDLSSYARRMSANGINVGRRMTKDDGWNRISIGQPHEMQAFVETLKAFRAKGWV